MNSKYGSSQKTQGLTTASCARRCPAGRKQPTLASKTTKADPDGSAFVEWCSGGVLLSRGASPAVPSALKGLTSGFGMGPGVSLSLWPPQLY